MTPPRMPLFFSVSARLPLSLPGTFPIYPPIHPPQSLLPSCCPVRHLPCYPPSKQPLLLLLLMSTPPVNTI